MGSGPDVTKPKVGARGHGAYIDMETEGAKSFCPKYLDK